MRKSLFLFLLVIFVSFMCCNVFAGKWIRTTLTYDYSEHEYFAEEIKIEINNEEVTFDDIIPVIMDSRTLIPVRGVFEKLGCKVEWDDKTQVVLITDADKQVVLQIGNDAAYNNGVEFKMDCKAKIINSRAMIPLRSVSEALGYQVDWSNEERLISISTPSVTTEASTQITTEASTQVTTEASTQVTTEASTQVTTEASTQVTTQTETQTSDVIQDVVVNDGLTILWDQVSNQTANQAFIDDKTVRADVICPTWFAVKDSAGTVSDLASPKYVQEAKSRGMKIWGLITNSFDPTITHNVLSDTAKRSSLVAEMLNLCEKYLLDGINIDFESVAKTDEEIYCSFIEEAAEAFKAKNLTISVDTYIPESYNTQYNIERVGKAVDYLIIMDYDEHYSTCGTAGSVSSLPWFTEAIKNSCEKVDKSKLIIGMPFYTRLWSENGGNVTSVSKSMSEAEELVKDKAVTYDEAAGQDYCEYTEGGIVYKIWLENEKSMKSRLEAAKSYGVSGAAFWRRGFEKPEIWDLINQYY